MAAGRTGRLTTRRAEMMERLLVANSRDPTHLSTHPKLILSGSITRASIIRKTQADIYQKYIVRKAGIKCNGQRSEKGQSLDTFDLPILGGYFYAGEFSISRNRRLY